MNLTPTLVLALFAAGIAAGAALVARWRIVGPGFLWVTGASVVLFGGVAAFISGQAVAWAGTVVALVASVAARRPGAAAAGFGLAAAAFAIVASADSPGIGVVTGVVLFGGVTTEMLLGHWFLVDPRLPRRSLKVLDVIGGAGLLGEVAFVVASSTLTFSGAAGVFTLTYLVLAAFTALLLVGVWFSLSEPRYSGVMAATGLSYLAVLTTFGVIALGRALAAGAFA